MVFRRHPDRPITSQRRLVLATVCEASLVTLAGSAPRCLRAGRPSRKGPLLDAVATTLEMQERPVRVETETDLADRFHPALADIRVLGNDVDVAKMALERVFVPNTGRTGERVNQVDSLGRRDRRVARRELQAGLAG